LFERHIKEHGGFHQRERRASVVSVQLRSFIPVLVVYSLAAQTPPTAAQLPKTGVQLFDSNGKPLASGKVYTYQAGTSTPLATFQGWDEATPNTNPIILDSDGRANIRLTGRAYRIVAENSAGQVQWSLENVTNPTLDSLFPPIQSASRDAASISYRYGAKGSGFTSVHDVLARSLSILDFGARCDATSHPLGSIYQSLDAARAVYPFVTSLTQELDWAGIMAAQNSLPINPTGRRTAAGNPIRMGRLLFPPSTCIIGETLLVSPEVAIQGTGGYSALVQGGPASGIQLKDYVATGPEYFVVAVDPADLGANSTFGVSFKDIQIDCHGGYEAQGLTGHNSGSSGLLFYGAQGSTWDNLVVMNCGRRGVVLPNTGGSGSGLAHFGSLFVTGLTQGPGLDIPETAAAANFALISAEHINPHGTYKDDDGDAYAGVRIVRSGDLHFTQIETEHDFLPVKIKVSWNIVIEHASIGPTNASKCPAECLGPGIKIGGGSSNISIRKWFTFEKAPYLYSTIIEDVDNGVILPGNLSNYPTGSYEQNTKESYLFNLRLLGDAWFSAINLKAVGTATPSANSSGNTFDFAASYWNGSSAAKVSWRLEHEIGSGTKPSSYLWVIPPIITFPGTIGGFGLRERSVSTPSQNYSSSPMVWRGSYWNGAGVVYPTVSAQYVVGSGTNPSRVMRFTGSDPFVFEVPALNSVGGYQANGTVGASRTVTVKGRDGADCNLVFTNGLFTSSTCP
jgi:hypothetical protein